MEFYTIDQTHHNNVVAEAIVGREQEIFHYDLNISNYELMLASLPEGDWPAELVQYQYSTLDNVPDEFDQIVSDYQYRDRLRSLLKTERLERSKAARIYEALLARLPEADRSTLIAAAQAKLQAANQA